MLLSPTTTPSLTTSCPKEGMRGYIHQCAGPLLDRAGVCIRRGLAGTCLVSTGASRGSQAFSGQTTGELVSPPTFPKYLEPSSETTPKACKSQKPSAGQEGTLASAWALVSLGHVGQAGATQMSRTILISQPIYPRGRQGGGSPERGGDWPKVILQGHSRGGSATQF